MAAYAEPAPNSQELIDLRNLSAADLNHLLLEETVEWEQELDWDFSRSADLVRKYADMRALGGAVARVAGLAHLGREVVLRVDHRRADHALGARATDGAMDLGRLVHLVEHLDRVAIRAAVLVQCHRRPL